LINGIIISFAHALPGCDGVLSADEISGPLHSILSHQENIEVLLDEVAGISLKNASFI
jgi:hypothetical protein